MTEGWKDGKAFHPSVLPSFRPSVLPSSNTRTTLSHIHHNSPGPDSYRSATR
jgi:hypothetical protein